MENQNKSDDTGKSEPEPKKKLPTVLLYLWISGWGGSIILAYLLLFSDKNYPTVFLALWMGLASAFFIAALVRLAILLLKK
ncbi:MAG: hypothetical protein JKY41_13400 [Rhodobacteraceae bacterium]|nr:hypothetical protein [Paracoccaceae bacterium]